MSMAARAVHCRLPQLQSTLGARTPHTRSRLSTRIDGSQKNNLKNNKIVLQPRLATLRSYSSDRSGGLLIKSTTKDGDIRVLSPFVDKLFDYIDTTKKSHDFEIISGRLAMIVFAGTVTTELLTGSSVFQKLDTQGIDEAALAGLAAIAFAAVFACGSVAGQRIGGLFDLTSNALMDSVVDQIVDGLFDEA